MNVTQQEVIQKTADFVKAKFEGEGSGHDWWHIYRVWQVAQTIARKEKADTFIVELGALLHDIVDFKFNEDEEGGGKATQKWLIDLDVNQEIIDKVVHIVNNVSFKGEANQNKMKSLEGKVVQDADRMDAIGAIGIGRCFAYGGYKGTEMYNPENKPKANMTKEEYKNNKGTSINHFYEKLLLLKDLMNTNTGKKMAQQRHKFMEKYLEQFFAEWEGKK
jgi:uncharacterized protein